jgi:hypothetical protein
MRDITRDATITPLIRAGSDCIRCNDCHERSGIHEEEVRQLSPPIW